MKYTVHEVELKNGAKGLFIDVPDVKLTRFNLSFRAGWHLCTSAKTETAHMLEHMIFKANKDYRDGKKFLNRNV